MKQQYCRAKVALVRPMTDVSEATLNSLMKAVFDLVALYEAYR
jgi:hypothetical protein